MIWAVMATSKAKQTNETTFYFALQTNYYADGQSLAILFKTEGTMLAKSKTTLRH